MKLLKQHPSNLTSVALKKGGELCPEIAGLCEQSGVFGGGAVGITHI